MSPAQMDVVAFLEKRPQIVMDGREYTSTEIDILNAIIAEINSGLTPPSISAAFYDALNQDMETPEGAREPQGILKCQLTQHP